VQSVVKNRHTTHQPRNFASSIPMKPNDKKAKYAILFIWIVLALEVVMFASSIMQYVFLKAAQAGASVTQEAAEANDFREGIIGIIYLIAWIVSAVFFLRWFKTAYHNLRQITDVRHAEWWTIVSWCIPIVNLFLPYQIMKELYIKTKEFLIAREYEISKTLMPDYLRGWWILWIINLCLSQGLVRLSSKAEEISQLILVTWVSMGTDIIGVLLALVTIRVIKDYARIEPLLQQIAPQPPHALPPPLLPLKAHS